MRKSKPPLNSAQMTQSAVVATSSTNKPVYALECFKEVPGSKRIESPKHQIIFNDIQTFTLTKTGQKTNQTHTFELTENESQVSHVFQADSQKHLDEWLTAIEAVLGRSACSSHQHQMLINHNKKLSQISSSLNDSVSSSSTSANRSSSSPLSNVNVGGANLAKPEIDAVSSFNESNDSSESFIRELDHLKAIGPASQVFLASFDLNKVGKYLNLNQLESLWHLFNDLN